MYVCEKGSLDVIQAGKKVNVLGPGKAFGELAVLYHSLRNASIVGNFYFFLGERRWVVFFV